MTRQVDIKALVSHIVSGDGMDKCRICMGDTSQGQVHLGDTVMMDGDRPITLSELLEVVTGVEVVSEEAIPSAICITCSNSALDAVLFRNLTQKANHLWINTLRLLEHLPVHQYSNKSDRIIAKVLNDDITIMDFCTEPEKEIHIEIHDPVKRFGKQHNCACPMCGMEFLYAQQLYKHLKESPDLTRACHICAEIMSREDLIKHLQQTHDQQVHYCKKCPAMYFYFKQYKEHLSKAHSSGISTCGDCGRTFQSLAALSAHLSIHINRSCPNCDKQFRNQKCYSYHVKKCLNIDSKLLKTKKFTITLKNKENKKVLMGKRGSTNKKCVCDYCKKTFAGKKYVMAHIQIVHTKDTHRPCTFCGKLFAAAHMTTHLKSHEAHMYECQQCGIRLKSKLGFSQHLRLHTGERPYKCQYCGETFSASSRRSQHILNTHKKSEIELKHTCERCPLRFRLPSKLKQHVKTAHGEGNQSDIYYQCAECKEKFPSCRSLLHHSRKHH